MRTDGPELMQRRVAAVMYFVEKTKELFKENPKGMTAIVTTGVATAATVGAAALISALKD